MTDPDEALRSVSLAKPSDALERRMSALFAEAATRAKMPRSFSAISACFVVFGAAAAALTLALTPTISPQVTVVYELRATPAMTAFLSELPASTSTPSLPPFEITSPTPLSQ